MKTVPGLDALARTPFVLRVLADALPRLERRATTNLDDSGNAVVGPQRRITRAQVQSYCSTNEVLVFAS